jgi:protein ImuB
VATIHDGHLPQARFRWQRLEALHEAHPRLVQTPRLVRRILDRPVAVSTPRRKEPDGWLITGLGGGAVEEVRGPYVISGGWWARAVHREYHYVRTARSGWLWVYFDRRRRRWYLQGSVE